MAVDAAAAISAEIAVLIAGNEDDLDESNPFASEKTWRTTKLSQTITSQVV